ncbi:MAG TPA: hypothetical protein ENK08_05030 [Chloroflexi bacterium]|nr:hypothetical protein [Chloroflexota bacterium]
MEKRFRVLRIIGTLYKVLAWIALIGGILGAFGVLLASLVGGFSLPREYGMPPFGGAVAGVGGFLVVLVMAVIDFIAFYGIGELIYLFIAIEENTRETALWVRSQQAATTQVAWQGATPPPPPPPPPSV